MRGLDQWFARTDTSQIGDGADYTWSYPHWFCLYPIAFNICISMVFTCWEPSTGMVIYHSDRGHRNAAGLNDGVGAIRYHMYGGPGYIGWDAIAIGW